MADLDANPEQLKILEEWMKSYQPEELFDENGRLIPELRSSRPKATAAWARTRMRMAGCF